MTEDNEGLVRKRILEDSSVVAVVGASQDSDKPAGNVPRFLKKIGFRVIPVNPNADEVFDEKAYETLLDIPEPVDVVEVFRPGEEAPDIARQAVAIGAKTLWLQLGITSPEARAIARDGGLEYVENHCMAVESRRFEISKGRVG